MKKLLALLLVCAMALGVCFLASCGGGAGKDKAYNNYLNKLKFDDSKCEKTLKVVTSPDFAPMEFYDAAKSGKDAIVGFDVLLAHYLAKELNMKLDISPMSFDACLVALQTGNADLAISGFSWTADRAENYEISDYYVAGENETEQTIIVKAENANQFTTADSFSGKKIGYQGSSLQELLVKDTFTGIADIDNPYERIDDAVNALKTGQIDAVAVAKGNADALIAASDGTLALSGFLFEVEEKYKNNVVLLQKGNTELLAQVNTALGKAMASGIYDDWYDACTVYAEISTLDEKGFDENGNKIED